MWKIKLQTNPFKNFPLFVLEPVWIKSHLRPFQSLREQNLWFVIHFFFRGKRFVDWNHPKFNGLKLMFCMNFFAIVKIKIHISFWIASQTSSISQTKTNALADLSFSSSSRSSSRPITIHYVRQYFTSSFKLTFLIGWRSILSRTVLSQTRPG